MGTLKSEMEPGQVHDIHYWLDYNDGQGNNSPWGLCMDDFKPGTIYLSHMILSQQTTFFFNSCWIQPQWCHTDLIRIGKTILD